MKILVVTFSFPSPARSGGERRLEALVTGLLSRHEVGIVCLKRDEPDPAFAARFALTSFVPPPPPRKPLRFGLGAIRAWSGLLFGSLPGFARATASREFALAVDHALAHFRPDAVYLEPVDVAHLIPRVRRARVPVCLGTIELVGEKMQRWMALSTSVAHRLAGRREIGRTRAMEAAALRAADVVLCVSDADREAIREWTNVEAVVVPNGVDAAEFAPRNVDREPGSLLALGPLTYAANLDAVEWFAREILPSLPGVRLDVVGRPPTTGVDFGDRVRILGMVVDIRPLLARAAVLVAPLRIGGGTRLKILEAMAMRTPVISTPIGVEGLDLIDGEHVLIADAAPEFAEQTRRVLDDPDLAERLGRKASDLVARRFGWERSVEALDEALTRIVPSARRAGR